MFHFLNAFSFLIKLKVPQNSEKKPRGLYFSKALSEGLIFGGAYIRRGLCTEGNLRFKIDWASLIVGRKFTVLLCFTLYLRAISKYKPPRGLIFRRGDLTEGFLRYEFGGLIFGILRYAASEPF